VRAGRLNCGNVDEDALAAAVRLNKSEAPGRMNYLTVPAAIAIDPIVIDPIVIDPIVIDPIVGVKIAP
jgi:hypothetical protein